ncbi:UTP20 [Candida oxycetoniae]|uniref:UTP20 n=1 Tax=Candida oxycetoniae TaxID=497107 RepID=A0AAI9WZ86_9ASCO|nr:UTP20 [Candida oxycetoniae]KAI3405650.2 UTP20 [Candida oxycetoniae]
MGGSHLGIAWRNSVDSVTGWRHYRAKRDGVDSVTGWRHYRAKRDGVDSVTGWRHYRAKRDGVDSVTGWRHYRAKRDGVDSVTGWRHYRAKRDGVDSVTGQRQYRAETQRHYLASLDSLDSQCRSRDTIDCGPVSTGNTIDAISLCSIERVESIKIEPSRKLGKRIHDEVESSHLLTTLEYWKELNLSGVFTKVVDEIEEVCQSLPQVLHHQQRIYRVIHDAVALNDIHSLQPLLELLSQFVHDLGPDFLVFYSKTLHLLTKVALLQNPNDFQNNKNTSNSLDWIFNTLAFIFKYLVKFLIEDLEPTFVELVPLLKLTNRVYISRFCAEALSFLIRKSGSESLTKFVQYCLNDQDILGNDNYCESLKIMFSESMKNTSGTFHTKAKIILSTIVECVVSSALLDTQPRLIGLLSDILLDVLHHGGVEACENFYQLVTSTLEDLLKIKQDDELKSLKLLISCQVLFTLCFADSGSKVKDWTCVLDVVDNIITKMSHSATLSRELIESFIYLLVIIFRNVDMQILLKRQKRIFDAVLSINAGDDFLLFAESGLAVAGKNLRNFGIAKYIQEYINKADGPEKLKRVVLFLEHTKQSNLFIDDKFIISKRIIQEISIASIADIESEKYFDLYWKLLLFQYSESCEIDIDILKNLLFSLPSTLQGIEISPLVLDILYQKLTTNTTTLSSTATTKEIINFLDKSFNQLNKSSNFLSTMTKIVEFAEDPNIFMQRALDCLYLPNHESRENAVALISKILLLDGKESTSLLSQINIIEQIPLTIDTSRDILLRVRNLVTDFAKDIKPSQFDKTIIVNYLFGLLSNRFQPCWKAVYETIPLISHICKNEIWQLAYSILTRDFSDNSQKRKEFVSIDSCLINWQPRNHKLLHNFQYFETTFFNCFRNIDNSITEICQESTNRNQFNSFLRTNTLQALKAAPSVADIPKLVPLVVNGETEDHQQQDWSRNDKNELLALFAQFKNLQKKSGSRELYDYMLMLLSSTHSKTQQLAIDVLFAFNDPVINKYKDNLKNLLDDITFSDEISTFIETMNFEDDKSVLMPLVIRILFGKVQGKPRSNSKQGNKNAVISFLPNFDTEDILSFIEVGANKLEYANYFNKKVPTVSLGLDKSELKRMTGFISLLQQIYEVLSKNYAKVLQATIQPLIYSLVSAQNRLDTPFNEDDEDKDIIEKIAKSIRSSGMRCLNELFKILGSEFDWSDYVNLISGQLIEPRLVNFANENLQQPSAVLILMCSWINQPNTIPFLYVNDFAAVKAILSILGHDGAKEAVSASVLNFAVVALEKRNESNDDYFTLLAIVVDSLLHTLPSTIKRIYNPEVGSLAIRTLLLMIQGEYIDSRETKGTLIDALTFALEKSNLQIDIKDKSNVLIALSSLLVSYDCTFDEILPLYRVVSKLMRIFAAKEIRETLAGCLETLGGKFEHLKLVADIIAGLNSFTTRMNEYDFERRLESFRLVNEEYYTTFDVTQWFPLINCALFFINDRDELAIRVNAGYMLKRFVDCYAGKPTIEEAAPYVHLLKDTILPVLRLGIRKDNEDVQSEYISVLEYIVDQNKYFTELSDLRILLGNKAEKEGEEEEGGGGGEKEQVEGGEEEGSSFFQDINHVQLHLRYRAIRRLTEQSGHLKGNSISHYILPIVEKYVLSKEEKYRNIGLESLEAISVLVQSVTWNQYKAILKRYLSNLKDGAEMLKQKVNLVVAISGGLKKIMNKEEEAKNIVSQDEIDDFILSEILPTIVKILQVRNDDTIVARAPLSEAAINFVLCLSPERIEGELPKILTSMCQVMRSRSEELRDAVRKSLGKIAVALGARYLSFILKELKAALSRGSQIHVLSYTVHYLLQCMDKHLVHGDLNESISMIIEIVMEDIFGAAGQEKDADGYTSKMKEVRFKKSYDSCEIVASNISLNQFGELIEPIRLLLRESITHKVQVKLDELLRRLSNGLNHNSEAANVEILHLCFEIFSMSSSSTTTTTAPATTISATEQHFLTTLNRKTKNHVDKLLCEQTMQRLSLELLRTAISRHENLLTTANLAGFVPLLEKGINSENESVVLASLRVLMIVIRLPFDEEIQGVLKTCARRAIVLIKDSPSTNSDLCQAALKFLATTIKHNSKVVLKDSAISYILTRIQPDLEEPNRQGLAFNFLKAVVSQHMLLPELYDVMDSVAKLMIVNHSKEIRDISRSVFFQFLMEYDQSKGRLEKQFKFLVKNLTYPTEEGRQSVMELIHLIIGKAGTDLLSKLGSSFFIALSNVMVSDSSSKSREMANTLLTLLVKKLPKIGFVEEYCAAWLKQSTNSLLKRCGFSVYKLLIATFGLKKNNSLDTLAISNIQRILNQSKFTEEGNDVEWELLYASISTFSTIATSAKDQIFDNRFKKIWQGVIDCLLYPHSWIRLITCRLVSILLSNLTKSKLDGDANGDANTAQLETIATKLIHQLRTPSLSDDLANQCTKNLVSIAMSWESHGTTLNKGENEPLVANDYLVGRVCSIVRQENVQSSLAKKAAIKFLAFFIQLTTEKRVGKVSEMIISSLYNFTDADYSASLADDELTNISLETLNIIKEKIGATEYTSLFAQVKQQVNLRRQSRRAKKAQLAITAPEVASKRKFKKHERSREKRKHERDENGYYKPKRKKNN